MKSQFFIASCVFFGAVATACTSDEPVIGSGLDVGIRVNGDSLAPVTITFAPEGYDISQTPFSEARTRADGLPRTRAAVSDICTRLDVWLVAGTDTLAFHQQKDDVGFGTITAMLDRTKTYRIIATGHKATGEATLTGDVIAWPDDKPTHTFFATRTFSPAETQSLALEMKRIVGQFRIETTDQVPESVKSFDIHIGSSPTRWNILTGADHPQDRHAPFPTFSTKSDGTVALSCFIIGSDTEQTYTFTVYAYDSDNNIIQGRTFADIPIRNNYQTTVRGQLFTNQSMAVSMSIADTWNTYDTINF